MKNLFNLKKTRDGTTIPPPIGNPRPDAKRIEENEMTLQNAFPDTNPLNNTRDSEITSYTSNPIRTDANVSSSTTYNSNDGTIKSLPVKNLVGIALDILKKTGDKLDTKTMTNAFPDSGQDRESEFNVSNPMSETTTIDENTSQDSLPLKDLANIDVDILKQSSKTDSLPINDLVGIAVDILKQSSKTDKEYSITQSARFKDIIISVEHINKYDKNGNKIGKTSGDKNESKMSTITPVYDENDALKIMGYKIEDAKTEGDAEIIDELDLGEINLNDLRDETKKPEIITNIIKNLKEKYSVGEDDELLIKEYLDNLGKVIKELKNTVEIIPIRT